MSALKIIKIVIICVVSFIFVVIPIFKQIVCNEKVIAHIDKNSISSNDFYSGPGGDITIDTITSGTGTFFCNKKTYKVRISGISSETSRVLLYVWKKHPTVFVKQYSVVEIFKPIFGILIIVAIILFA